MRFIIKDKVYDTEKSEKILEYGKPYEALIFGRTTYLTRAAVLYKTKKGSWFSVVKMRTDKFEAQAESVSRVKQILKDLNEVGIYAYHFGELEEA